MNDRELDEAESVVAGLSVPDRSAYGDTFTFTWHELHESMNDTDSEQMNFIAVRMAEDIDKLIVQALKSGK